MKVLPFLLQVNESSDSESHKSSISKNIFDNLPALQAPKPTELGDELDRYLSTDPEHAANPLAWWYEHKHVYPRLHRMARDYLSIPGKDLPSESQICFLMISPIIFQRPLLMLNEPSAKVDFYFHMYATGFQFSRHGRYCVSEFGA